MRSLINPFSVFRHLDLWSVAAFETQGGGRHSDTHHPGALSQQKVEEAAHDVVAGESTVENFVSEQLATVDIESFDCALYGLMPDTPTDLFIPQLVPLMTKLMNDTLGPGEGQITPDMMFNDGGPMDTGVFGKEAADTAPDATIAAAQDDGGATAMGAAFGGKETDAPTTDGRGEAKPDPVAEKVQQTMDEATVQGASPSETGDDRGSRTDEVRPGPDDDQDQDDQTAEVPASVDP